VVNLERRPDRWERVKTMLETELPWLAFEHFAASDGSKMEIPESEVSVEWNTKCNAVYADFNEWVFDEPGTETDGTQWKWADGADSDERWTFVDNEDGTGTVQEKDQEVRKVKLQFAQRFIDPGQVQRMSGGERGCAHSHRRLWEVAAGRELPTLVLEDDVQVVFERTGDNGTSNGKIFTERLAAALKYAPQDFDVVYLGWSGWRGGHHKVWNQEDGNEEPGEPLGKVASRYIRKAEYVWTTVAYVISQAGAKKLLSVASPVNQPVDNFMAWEAAQGRLKSFVAVDAGDEDDTWAGGIVDQVDFQGDSDIKKSDGGVQGDDAKDFAVLPSAA